MRYLEEGRYEGEFLISEAPGFRSRQRFMCSSIVALAAGTLVALVAQGAPAAVAAAKVGNAGNGVLTLANPAVAPGANNGIYVVRFDEPVANAGAFQVFDPAGALVGDGKVGVAFDGPVRFTIADGATDFATGDGFNVTVSHAAVAPGVVAWNPAGNDGSEDVLGNIWGNYDPRFDANDAVIPTEIVVIERDAEVDGNSVDFPVGVDADATLANKAAGIAGLLRRNIKVRF